MQFGTALEISVKIQIGDWLSRMWTHCKPTQGHRGRPIFWNQARSGRVV